MGDHLSKDCSAKCKDCGVSFCPGNSVRCELCAVTCDIPPSKRSPPVSNFFGKPLPPHLIAKLDAAWKVKHPGKEVSALEISAPDSDSDTEVFGLCHPGA